MSRTKTFSFLLAACAIMAIVLSCTDEPTAPPPPGSGDTLAVTVVEVAPTALNLRLHFNSAGEYRLDRDGTTAWSGSITPPDTVFTDTGLLPATEYHYTLSHVIDGDIVSTSTMTVARTGDTVSHEFVWEVDTLFWTGTNQPAFFDAKAFYGTSASNVYMVGYSTSAQHKAWHWNGSEWKTVPLAPQVAGSVNDVDGIDPSFIVFAGEGPGTPGYTGLMSLDNNEFKLLPLAKGKGKRTCLHVVSRNEIYIGGADGIQRYDGTKWEWVLDSTDAYEFEFQPRYIYKFPNGMLECQASRVNAMETDFDGECLLRFINGQFTVVDSFMYSGLDKSSIRFGYTVLTSDDGIYSIGQGGTYIWNANEWVRIHDEWGGIIGGTRNNLIMGQGKNYIWHFNGSTKRNLYKDVERIAPTLRSLNTGTFIDGVLFLAGELQGSERTPVVIRGRQRGG